jgi:hypothetical protein
MIPVFELCRAKKNAIETKTEITGAKTKVIANDLTACVVLFCAAINSALLLSEFDDGAEWDTGAGLCDTVFTGA